ncbi:type VI secretion system contractile sheath large subunit [Desulfovibrio sp. JC022]|uniref:type VI secretion system contractile sheath domain-containing protein n=1 Tax=Desulfovibrio sp. JC022 TaxID=2593642 RepID=UPI0013D872CF|nr:type VI secretion system contractile sheath large subunit [Desulfovibrio sp. JC022]NDV23340.1 type VI secretion system contractile sheath large subunit [Desulfovibrio sp. JC022]
MHIELPAFKILALAPFSPTLETDNPPRMKAGPSSLDQALTELQPTLDIPLDRSQFPVANISICISRLADFRPKNISKTSVFKVIINQMAKESPPSEQSTASNQRYSALLDDILSMVDSEQSEQQSPSTISQHERPKNELLKAIFADPAFRKMEAAWRGLELLGRQVPSGSKTSVEFMLVPVTENNLLPVLNKLEEELGASPPDLVLLDHGLSNTPRSMEILERIMNFAESMLAPAIIAFGPQFLELQNWAETDKLPFIPTLLEGAEYGRWKTLRQQPAAGWIMGCAGSIMGRTMHGTEAGFDNTSLSERGPLWVSSVWAAAALCARSLSEYGRGTLFSNHSSVRLEGLPLAEGPKPSPINPPIGTERIKDFRQAGINTLAFNGDQAFLLGAVSMDGGPINVRLYLSRLIHFLILLSTEKRKEFSDIEMQLTEAVSLFLQKQGYPEPHDLSIKKGEPSGETVPLEISLSPGPEILPGNAPISFGFNW